MITKLLRAAGGAASFTLASIWPVRVPAFPVGFFDFDMFNEPADALWDRTSAEAQEKARALDEQAREYAAQTAIPPQELPSAAAYRDFLAATLSGDLGGALNLAERFAEQFSKDLADILGIDLTSSAAGEAGEDKGVRSPSAEDGPAPDPESPRAGAGQPNLTVGELEDAAYAVRRHIERLSTEIGAEAWTHLAEKLEATALSK